MGIRNVIIIHQLAPVAAIICLNENPLLLPTVSLPSSSKKKDTSRMFENDSTLDLTYTFHYSKLSCWKPVFIAHIVFAYLILFSGLACFFTRLIPRLHHMHLWFGRSYIVFMLWGTGTSLLIHNTGLPVGVLWSFLWCLGGLTFGLAFITVHQHRRSKVKPVAVFDRDEKPTPRKVLIVRRLFSFKAMHGYLMFVSWINIAGRVFVTPLRRDFECYTYPVYKPVSSQQFTPIPGQPLTLVPHDDPNYERQPWANNESGWALALSVGPFLGAMLVSASWGIFLRCSTNPFPLRRWLSYTCCSPSRAKIRGRIAPMKRTPCW